MPAGPQARPGAAPRQALRDWALLHADSAGAIAWAQLVVGYHPLYLSTPQEAIALLEPARQACADCNDRAGVILAEAGIARAWWRQGRSQDAHRRLVALRNDGLQVLRHDQRSVLL